MKNFKCTLLVFSLALLGAVPAIQAEEAVKVADLVSRDTSPLDRSRYGGVVSYSESLAVARPPGG